MIKGKSQEDAMAGADHQNAAPARSEHGPVMVDLGKQKRKLVRRLRKGQGKLMEEVNDLLQQMSESGQIQKDAQPVIVVVRQKPRSSRWRLF
jgi:paraquat-inducible protein B